MDFITDIKNDLLKRREIKMVIESASNPGIESSKKMIAEKAKSSEENVVIRSVKNNFGSNKFSVEAFVYNSKEDKERIEPRRKEKKNRGSA